MLSNFGIGENIGKLMTRLITRLKISYFEYIIQWLSSPDETIIVGGNGRQSEASGGDGFTIGNLKSQVEGNLSVAMVLSVHILDGNDHWFERGVKKQAIYANVQQPSLKRGGRIRHHLFPVYNAVLSAVPRRFRPHLCSDTGVPKAVAVNLWHAWHAEPSLWACTPSPQS